jgi:hypothetical protein
VPTGPVGRKPFVARNREELIVIDPKRHADSRGMIESVLRSVPGFRGYLEKDYRQESDHLVRRWMADRLQQSKRSLDTGMTALIDAGRLDQLTAWERVKNRLDALILRLRSAVRGYSGFFDFVEVNVDLLDQVYEHDMLLVQSVEKLATVIEQTAGGGELPDSTTGEWLRQIDEIDRRFSQRGEMLNGLNASMGV